MSYHNLDCESCDEDFYVCDHIYRAMNQRGHVVDFRDDDWGLEHPISCRAAGLINCPMNNELEGYEPGVDRPLTGRYVFSVVEGIPRFEALIEANG